MLEIDFDFFNNDWDVLLRFLGRRGNPPYIITGNLNLSFNKTIKSLGNLQSVGGYLDLRKTDIKSLGNLQSVGRGLYLTNTPLSKTTTEEEIRSQVEVGGYIYF